MKTCRSTWDRSPTQSLTSRTIPLWIPKTINLFPRTEWPCPTGTIPWYPKYNSCYLPMLNTRSECRIDSQPNSWTANTTRAHPKICFHTRSIQSSHLNQSHCICNHQVRFTLSEYCNRFGSSNHLRPPFSIASWSHACRGPPQTNWTDRPRSKASDGNLKHSECNPSENPESQPIYPLHN